MHASFPGPLASPPVHPLLWAALLVVACDSVEPATVDGLPGATDATPDAPPPPPPDAGPDATPAVTPCRGPQECSPGEVCVVSGPASGTCRAEGPGAAGEPCAAPEECGSWACFGGRCLARCDEAECPEGSACLTLHTQSVCVDAGPGGDEAPCGRGADCASGVCRGGRCTVTCGVGLDCPNDRSCLLYETVALCERSCATSADCGPEGVCLLVAGRRICEIRGDLPPEAPCERDAECAGGRCQQGACATPCAADGSCPAQTVCVRDITGSACRPAGPASDGAPCDRGEDCQRGVCGAGRCGGDCAADAACAAGMRCTSFSDGRFCFPACRTTEDCPGPAYCDGGFAEGPTCFWRGESAAGSACARASECASGACAGERCLAACTAGPCPAGLQCVDVGAGPYCVGAALPLLAACNESDDRCGDGLVCTAGRCTPTCVEGCPRGTVCLEGRCQPTCEVDAECRPGRRCNRLDLGVGYCEAPGRVAVGEPCDRSGRCASGLCFGGICRGPCEPDCPDGHGCLSLEAGAWCVPAGAAAPAARCARDRECASGLCVGRRCATPCAGGRCPAGLACQGSTLGPLCVDECTPPGGCDPDEVCDPTVRRCALDGGGAAPVGGRCETRADCTPATATCHDAGEGPRCRGYCDPAAPECSEGEACVALRDDLGACVPSGGGAPLDPCAEDLECASARCLQAYLGGRCYQPCGEDADCGEGACVDLARDPAAPVRACAPSCAEDADCAAPLLCRRRVDGVRGCY